MNDQYNLVGKIYTFTDGNRLEVLQIKLREEHNITVPVVTCMMHSLNGLPKKQVMKESDFVQQFGHLFGIKPPPTRPR